jgi:hypothetical protein
MAERRKKHLTITNKTIDGFRIYPAEGAFGGIKPSQMFQINFYVEYPNIPTDITHELTPEGKLGEQLDQKVVGGDFVREVQCAVQMTLQQAEALARWILSTLDQHRDSSTPHSEFVM